MSSIRLHHPTRTITYLMLLPCILLSSALPFRRTPAVQCTAVDDFKNLVIFFLANYVAHAATVPTRPGAGMLESMPWRLVSLMYPLFGLTRSTVLFKDHFTYGRRDEIGKAISRGAIMVAARSNDWEPHTENQEVYVRFPPEFPRGEKSHANLPKAKFQVSGSVSRPSTTHPKAPRGLRGPPVHGSLVHEDYLVFHGETSLPNGYEWVVPQTAFLETMLSRISDRGGIHISKSQGWMEVLASVIQLVLSSLTIYHTRGPQLDRYGYAAFGLSVYPYTLMSFVNLVVIGFIKEYPSLFVLRTAISDEIKGRGGSISGEIGTLQKTKAGEANAESFKACESREARTSLGANSDAPGDMESSEADDDRNHETEDRIFLLQPWPDRNTYTKTQLHMEIIQDEKIVVATIGDVTRKFKLVDHNGPSDNFFTLDVDSMTNQPKGDLPTYPPNSKYINMAAAFIFGLLAAASPYLVIYLLTGFKKRESTIAERGWMMAWIAVNQLAALFVALLASKGIFRRFSFLAKTANSRWVDVASSAPMIILYSAPAVGGFVMVGKMITEFGSCSLAS